MGSLSIGFLRKEYLNKSDAEIATELANKEGYIAIVRFKSHGAADYTHLGTCTTEEEINGYFNSPYCSDVEILYDIRSNALKITRALILHSKCSRCGHSATQESLSINHGNDFYFCPVCATMFCQNCLSDLPLTNYPYGYAKCPTCDAKLQRALVGVIGNKALLKDTTTPQTAMKKCVSCKTQYEEWRNRCPKCGQSLSIMALTSEQASSVLEKSTKAIEAAKIVDESAKLFLQGKLKEAEDKLKKAIEINPYNAVAHGNMGHIFMTQGMYTKAIPLLKKALELDPFIEGVKDGLTFSIEAEQKKKQPVSDKVVATLKKKGIKFVRKFTEVRDSRLGNTEFTYEKYESSSLKKAMRFLKAQTVSLPFYYIEVKTPKGWVGKDIQGTYKE